MDPSHTYDWMRDFVEDGQPALDVFLALAPKRWPVIDSTISTNDAINLTQNALYPMSVLQDLRTSRNLSTAQWRQVGNNQKTLWRNRLLRRVGHAPAGSVDPPFEFDDIDWKNIFQLEAIVELYANYDDPWAPGAVPRNPGTAGFIVIDFLDLAGAMASAAGAVVTLDGNPDLRRVRVNVDTILLETDTGRATRLYRITAVNNATHTVTVDAAPVLAGGTSAWKITLRPVIIIIDSFGGRLSGSSATLSAANVLTLDGPPTLSRVNPNFDTVYLPSDTGRPARMYRITAVNNAAHSVTVDGNPVLAGGSSAWHIQSGISGELPTLVYNLGPGGAQGFDHFDGNLFVVQGGEIHTKIRWNSYTSRAQVGQGRSSLRGNRRYDFSSFRSANAFRNYSFKVVDVGAAYDGVREARFYFSTPVTSDQAAPGTNPNGGGKTVIRLHYSVFNNPGGGCSSAGCLVAPSFYNLRDALIDLYETEYTAFHGPGTQDVEVNKARGLTHAQSQQLWNGTIFHGLTAAHWNNRIVGALWVIRPDERPL